MPSRGAHVYSLLPIDREKSKPTSALLEVYHYQIFHTYQRNNFPLNSQVLSLVPGLSLNRPSLELQKTFIVTNGLSVVATQEMSANFMHEGNKVLCRDG